MKKIYLVLLLASLIMGLTGCFHWGCKLAPPPPPFAPFDVVATAVSSTQIDLTWKETAENEKGFYVYRRSPEDMRKIAVLDPNTTSYSDTSLEPATSYSYKVTTFDADRESEPSNEAFATTFPSD